MEAELTGSHRKTYEHLFSHPMPQNLDWRDLVSLLNALPNAEVVEAHDGNLKVTRGEHTVTLHKPKGKDYSDRTELTQLKHFLEQSKPSAAQPAAEPAAAGTHLLVVIDHSQARIYSAEMRGAVPHQIKPYDPFGFARELRSSADDGNGKRSPELKSYYEAVAKTLRGAHQILLFGTGTGASNAAEHLLAELQKHHHDVAAKVIATATIDEKHMTDDQLLAKAREIFAG